MCAIKLYNIKVQNNFVNYSSLSEEILNYSLFPYTGFLVSDDHNMTGSTIATKFSCNKKIKPQSLEGYEKDFRPYVLNPKYSCPTSLPLYFYFGYQLLQETEQMKECGPVRHRLINKINKKKIVSKFSQICHIVL